MCPELDFASQGLAVEATRANTVEALKPFFEFADPTDVTRRLHSAVFVTQVEAAIG